MQSPPVLLERIRAALLAELAPSGHWTGELAASALSTATAIVALHGAGGADPPGVAAGARWLIDHQNADGGWGDTVLSLSNLSTTVLVWAALGHCAPDASGAAAALANGEWWIRERAGGLDAPTLVRAVEARYGKDRTFAVPILTLCAIAGRLGPDPWRWVKPLPFELAACPRGWFRLLRLQVVSYALPALIAVGQVRFRRRPPRNPLARAVRALTRACTLRLLAEIQPTSGGYLEAVPLTSFVAMSLAAAGDGDLPVAARCRGFLLASARADGSWPIDVDLATWVTTLAIGALGAGGDPGDALPPARRRVLVDWLLGQQHRELHPYTGSPPGGWAWTDLPGGVPDADDTAGALLALRQLAPDDARVVAAARLGVAWLLGLQNRDGGIPTFCRGWGALPFDRSAPDLTAHAIVAWQAWRERLPALRRRIDAAVEAAIAYLGRTQDGDGSWSPLWFGNQHRPDERNPTYATARVIAAFATLEPARRENRLDRAVAWLALNQNPDGGWGCGPGTPSTIEETALAVDALAACPGIAADPRTAERMRAGLAHLAVATKGGAEFAPSPIGFYFAKLWYFERLYPLIFAASAVARANAAGVGDRPV